MVTYSYEHGLGRHFFYLEPMQRQLAMKYNFISQPLAVTAAMLSRTGVVVFLYACFAKQRKTLQIVILTLLVTQIVINMITILQVFLRSGCLQRTRLT